MAIKITANTKPWHTRRELIEDYYPELWESANGCVSKLKELQNRCVERLPFSKAQLPNNYVGLQEMEAQVWLLEYIYLRSLYAFANEMWTMIDKRCRDLADAKNNGDYRDIDDKEQALSTILEAVSKIPFEELISNQITDFYRLVSIVDHIDKNRIDFSVYAYWHFHDIVGTLNNHGILYHDLWKDAVSDVFPTSSRIGELLDDD